MLSIRTPLAVMVAGALLAVPVSARAESGPVDEVAKLSVWEGNWKAEANFAKCPRTPNGGRSSGFVSVKRALGGQSFISNYRYNGDLGPFEGHMVMSYDAKNKSWAAWWFDSLEPATCDQSTGTLNGDTFVIDSTSQFRGETYKTRMTQKFVDASRIEETYEADHGQGMQPEMSIVYTRMTR